MSDWVGKARAEGPALPASLFASSSPLFTSSKVWFSCSVIFVFACLGVGEVVLRAESHSISNRYLQADQIYRLSIQDLENDLQVVPAPWRQKKKKKKEGKSVSDGKRSLSSWYSSWSLGTKGSVLYSSEQMICLWARWLSIKSGSRSKPGRDAITNNDNRNRRWGKAFNRLTAAAIHHRLTG